MGSSTSSASGGVITLIDAVKNRDEKKVKELIRAKISLTETDQAGNGALHIIAKEGHYKFPPSGIPKLLIDSGIDINAKNSNGATALEISLLSGWQKIAIVLLDNGADKAVVTSGVKSRITCPDCRKVVRDYSL